jgi:hypothetical protein
MTISRFLTLLIVTFNFALLTFNLSSVRAQSMSNDEYMLRLQVLDTSSDKQETDESVTGISSEKSSNQEQNPKIKTQDGTLAFSISETLIYFGPLSPTNPILRSNKISLKNHSPNGYSIIAFEDKELSWLTTPQELEFPEIASQSGAAIPDTSCDEGLCSETNSAPWTNTLTYGFGFRTSDFSEPESYRQFANISKNETPQTIISRTGNDQENIYQITYKVNIAGTQAKGYYGNSITFIAAPNF